MSSTATAAVDTGKVLGRRRIHFNSVEEIISDVDALAARGYRQLGNWSLGQMCKHLAMAMSMKLDGSTLNPPWFVKLVAKNYFKPKVLRHGMKPGFKLKPSQSKGLIPDATADSEGIEALRKMVKRYQSEPTNHPHPFFGKLTQEEWDKITLSHSAMHLSFLLPN